MSRIKPETDVTGHKSYYDIYGDYDDYSDYDYYGDYSDDAGHRDYETNEYDHFDHYKDDRRARFSRSERGSKIAGSDDRRGVPRHRIRHEGSKKDRLGGARTSSRSHRHSRRRPTRIGREYIDSGEGGYDRQPRKRSREVIGPDETSASFDDESSPDESELEFIIEESVGGEADFEVELYEDYDVDEDNVELEWVDNGEALKKKMKTYEYGEESDTVEDFDFDLIWDETDEDEVEEQSESEWENGDAQVHGYKYDFELETDSTTKGKGKGKSKSKSKDKPKKSLLHEQTGFDFSELEEEWIGPDKGGGRTFDDDAWTERDVQKKRMKK